MQLADRQPAATDLAAVVCDVLDRRLRRDSPHPVAVALSGGGDSVALLLAARDWAQAAARPLIALTVDHRLQPQSRAWTKACAGLAERLGVGFRALAWTEEKPTTGLAAAARAARHCLLAQAAREAGARVLLMGHTADDVLEAEAMRARGATTPSPRAWAPSPAWPEGRGLFLLRPLLEVRRGAIRTWLAARGEAWIDDPANAAAGSLRAQIRHSLDPTVVARVAATPPLSLAETVEADAAGGLRMARDLFVAASDEAARRLMAMAVVCAGGGDRRPAAAAAARLAAAVRGGGEVTAVLAGARLTADAQAVRWSREAGEAARGGLAVAALGLAEPMVWDGRFEVTARRAGLAVRRLAGVSRRLPVAQRRRLAEWPATLRPALPVVMGDDGAVSCPLLGGEEAVVRSLVGERLRAACGLVPREP